MAAILSVSAMVFAVLAAGETISQVGAPPASFATYDLEVDLTPWGYIVFFNVPPDASPRGSNLVETAEATRALTLDAQGSLTDNTSSLRENAETKVTHPAAGTSAKVSCKTDWDCRDLERTVKLDKPVCVGQIFIYDASWGKWADKIFKQSTGLGVLPYLAGKSYTYNIQTGYKIKYGCVNNTCQIVKREPILVGCKFGCLVTPVEYEGKTWSNFCVCLPGSDYSRPIKCGEGENNRYAYDYYTDWTCEKKKEIVGICPIRQRCVEKEGETDCEDIPGPGPIKYPDGSMYPYEDSGKVKYVMTLPRYLDKPIYIAAVRNGKIIAKKPISNLSAKEYINRYGPVDFSKAYEFALKTGLVAEVAYALGYEDNSATLVQGTILNVNLTEASTDEHVYRLW